MPPASLPRFEAKAAASGRSSGDVLGRLAEAAGRSGRSGGSGIDSVVREAGAARILKALVGNAAATSGLPAEVVSRRASHVLHVTPDSVSYLSFK